MTSFCRIQKKEIVVTEDKRNAGEEDSHRERGQSSTDPAVVGKR